MNTISPVGCLSGRVGTTPDLIPFFFPCKYTEYGDILDTDGHGTKCAASIAGVVLSDPWDRDSPMNMELATGMAPKARISMVDFQISSRTGLGLLIPERVDLEYLPVSYEAQTIDFQLENRAY